MTPGVQYSGISDCDRGSVFILNISLPLYEGKGHLGPVAGTEHGQGWGSDREGNVVSQRRFGEENWDYVMSIIQVPTDQYSLVGYTDSQGAGEEDVYLAKMIDPAPVTRHVGQGQAVDFALALTAGAVPVVWLLNKTRRPQVQGVAE